jgi:hypothetical protein
LSPIAGLRALGGRPLALSESLTKIPRPRRGARIADRPPQRRKAVVDRRPAETRLQSRAEVDKPERSTARGRPSFCGPESPRRWLRAAALTFRAAPASRLPLPFTGEILDLISVHVEHDLTAAGVLILDHHLRAFPVFYLGPTQIRNKNCLPCHSSLLLTWNSPSLGASVRVPCP